MLPSHQGRTNKGLLFDPRIPYTELACLCWDAAGKAVRNIFLLYIPPSNHEAVVHYEDTIRAKVTPDRIYKYVDRNLRQRLEGVFGSRPIAVWGSRDSQANRAKFERMVPGDEILIVEGDSIKLLGKVAATTVNGELSRELWKNLRGESAEGWDLIYFIANPIEIDLSFSKFCQLFGYAKNYQLRGFTSISTDKLTEFYEHYDDLYSILVQIKQGKKVYEKPKVEGLNDDSSGVRDAPRTLTEEDVSAVLEKGELSDHVKMQWTLIRLGIKCGSKVWIPAGDQGKVRSEYNFDDFEKNFASGLDTQTKYVENIDVVWKEEFRIDAAFEIENSTAIYSGLLRFADLSLVAPNTIYPLFIVAPREKRNRLIEQLKRPIFKHLDLDRKVRYLSYEAVNEIDDFARNMEHGLNVSLVSGKAENIQIAR
jgi:hypothetical protein